MSWKGMEEHLRSLQERRQQLESSIVIDPDASILSNMTEMIRDRELARVRMTVRRNMESIDKQIKETIRRLGTALALSIDDGSDVVDPTPSIPDVVPSLPRSSGRNPESGSDHEKFLESVRTKLIQRRQLQQQQPKPQVPLKPPIPDEQVEPPAERPMSSRGSGDSRSRVGLYHMSHQASPREDQWNRLNIQILPSVTIATGRDVAGTARIHSEAIRSVPDEEDPPDPPNPGNTKATDTVTTHPHPAVDPVAAVTADDVAVAVAQILQDQLDQAWNSMPIQSNQIDQRIDNGTQTETHALPLLKDSAVDPMEWTEHADAVTQWIDPDDPALDDWPLWPVKVAPSVDSIDQLEERSLTPPRGPIRPPEPSLPDVADWPHEPDRSTTPPLEASATLRRLSSAEMSSTGTSSCSSSLQMASHSTLPDSSTSQEAISGLSEGEVLFRVPSPGQISDLPAAGIDSSQRHLADGTSSRSLSHGEVILQSMDRSTRTAGFNISPSDGSASRGEVLLRLGAASADSTLDSALLSFHTMEDGSSSGSSGQIRLPVATRNVADSGSTTGDDVTHDLDTEIHTN